jgi:hypothetical protein
MWSSRACPTCAPRILGECTGPAMLRAYMTSNLAFMRDHRKDMTAILKITRGVDGGRIFQDDPHVIDAVRALEHLLSGLQTARPAAPRLRPLRHRDRDPRRNRHRAVPAGPGPRARYRQLRQ